MSQDMAVLRRPLSGDDIERVLRHISSTKNIFLGIFARGLYPRKVKTLPAFFIINTDYYFNDAGIHWVLIFWTEEKTYFYDPFGLAPSVYNFPLLTERYGEVLTRNTQCVQNYSAQTCGLHCLFMGVFLYVTR